MNIEVSGSGSIRLNVNANKLNSEISGSGTLFLTGQVSEHNIEIDGSGRLKSIRFENKNERCRHQRLGYCTNQRHRRFKLQYQRKRRINL